MKHIIVTLPLVPLRAAADERAEMVSQLLFGEMAEVLDTSKKWLKIRNLADNYVGFADRKMLTVLSENAFEFQKNLYAVKTSVPVTTIYNVENQPIIVPFGSTLWLDNKDICFVNNEKYFYDAAQIVGLAPFTMQDITHNAKKFLNAPYLWGGKSVFGIDCSGLVQLIFANFNVRLPRDTTQQVTQGTQIPAISVARQGDLAFFENEDGKIIHVGILLNNRQIIHSSGSVKIENVDENGIISAQTNEYTHKLAEIRRIF
ncbi:MAG: C40 family peptidase [Prevotellaceae bacterium]|nr:C40 family peptidase [Prevotellaceae bacterium]